MKVLMINPAMEKFTRGTVNPLGLLSIATQLDKAGHTVEIIDRTIIVSDIFEELESFKPDVVGVSVLSMKSFADAMKVSTAAQSYGAKVVWGGVFVSLSPQLALDKPCVDIISIGEGETTWLELLTTLENKAPLDDVKGIAFMKNGKLFITPERDFIDLAELYPIDFKFIDVEKYLFPLYGCDKVFLLYMAKGCIGNCSFCFNETFHKCTYRRRPVEHFLQEVRFLVENYGVDGIYFADELWCKNRDEMHEQCKAFKESGIEFQWGAQTRIGIFNKEDFKYMYECGCRWMAFGIETGSPEMLSRINKGIPYHKIEPTFEGCSEAGIISLASFIIGHPGETSEQLKETVDLAKRIKATQRTFFFLFPAPGTPIFNELVHSGQYTPPSTLEEYSKVKLFFAPKPNFSCVPSKELKTVRAFFLWKAFSRKSFSDEAESYSIAKKNIMDVLRQFRGHGFKFAISLFAISAYEFTSIFYHSHFHPFIVKKYDLKLDDSKHVVG